MDGNTGAAAVESASYEDLAEYVGITNELGLPVENDARPPKRSRPIKRSRRTKAEIAVLREIIYETIAAERPMTVRQVFYQLVTKGVIDKTEAAYKGTVVRLLGDMRRDGQLPFSWIADNTRWHRKPDSHGSLAALLEDQVALYRRDIWRDQDAYVEIWLEKEALAGVLYQETAEWDVRLMVTRGYPSISYLHAAAEAIGYQDKPAYLYYFGDHDPSGVDIPRKVEEDLRTFAPDADIHFERVAVTPRLIEELDLPTRPTKKTDSRAKNFVGESVEVDAIPPATIRAMVRQCVEQHVDTDRLDAAKQVEQLERDTLADFLDQHLEAE